MNTNPVECYIVSRAGRFLNATPAKVVRETVSTITVKMVGADYERTFQKEKRYEQGYLDPRQLNNYEFGFRSTLHERGHKWSSTSLSFDIERVEAQIAEEKLEKELIGRFNKVKQATEIFFFDHRHPAHGNADFLATLGKLESVFSL